MFKTPNKKNRISIMGNEIEILIDDEELAAQSAIGIYKDNKIYLLSEYKSYKEYKDTYTHECFHALCDILGVQIDHNLEEVLANRVGIMVAHEM